MRGSGPRVGFIANDDLDLRGLRKGAHQIDDIYHI